MYSIRDIHSPSPYLLSSPCTSDSEDEPILSSASLRSSIASLPEGRLRAILHKLADSNPRFQQAISRELAHAQAIPPGSPTTPTTPTSNKQRRKRRRSSTRRTPKPVSLAYHTEAKTQVIPPHVPYQLSLYHPGHLEEEVYEFVSASPHDHHDPSFQVVQTITMWSCCDEDAWSPGCMSVPIFPSPVDYGAYDESLIDFRHPDTLSGSEVEQR